MPSLQKNTSKYTLERSRFFALTFDPADLEEIKKIIKKQERKYPRARHHCWACRIKQANGQVLEQARDDGEVGKPASAMLEMMRGRDLFGAVVVSRVFGGVKLGPGGVKRAFQKAFAEALGE